MRDGVTHALIQLGAEANGAAIRVYRLCFLNFLQEIDDSLAFQSDTRGPLYRRYTHEGKVGVK